MASLEEAINSLRGEIYNVPPSESAVKYKFGLAEFAPLRFWILKNDLLPLE